MDLQVALISLGVIVLSAAVVYLISILGTKETSYEEAVAEQRRKGVELLGELTRPGGNARDRGKQHAKKWGRKSKERGGEHEHNGLHVDFKTEAEIIPDETSDELTVPPTASRARRHSDEPRSILVTKRVQPVKLVAPLVPKTTKPAAVKAKEPSPPKVKEPTPPKTKEPSPPKTEVEGGGRKGGGKKEQEGPAASRESSKEKEEPHAKKEKSKEREIPKIVPEKAKVKEMSPPLTASSAPNSKASAKQKQEGTNGSQLASQIKMASLSNDDIQTLVEALLNKRQHETESCWLKAGQKVDPVEALRKQVEEREQALNDESARAATLATKLKEAKQELLAEKSRSTQLERVAKEGQQEVQVARKRSDQAVMEAKAFQVKIQEMESKTSEDSGLAVKLQEEIEQMKLSATQLESKYVDVERERDELRNTTSGLSAEITNLQQALDQQHHANNAIIEQLQEQVQALGQAKTDEASWMQQLDELRANVQRLDDEKAVVLRDFQAACTREESLLANTHATQQRLASLDEINQAKVMLEFQTKELRENLNNTQNHTAVLQNQIGELSSKLAKVEQENVMLREEIDLLTPDVVASERQEAEGQEGSGEASPKEKTNGHVQVATEDAGRCPSPTIALAAHENMLLEKEKMLEQLSGTLTEQKSAAQELVEQVEKYKGEVTDLNVNIEAQKSKNNELRQKNWKAMEAITSAENLAGERLKQVEKLQIETHERLAEARREEQNLSKEIMRRIFPTIKMQENLTYSLWIDDFEKRAVDCLAQLSASSGGGGDSADLATKLATSQEVCAKLEYEIQRYKRVLAQTEAMLNKLQSSVEEEELRWKEKLEAKEKQLEKYDEGRKSLEASLVQIRAAEEAASEMQAKLRELQEKLQMEEGERRALEETRTAMDGEISRLQSQLHDTREEIRQWKLERESSEAAAKELEAVKEELTKERQTCKTLSAQNVKLNSLVKIGQDALKAESEMVASLEGQMNALKEKQTQNATTNGSPLASQESPEAQSRASRSVGRSPTSSLSSLLHRSSQPSALDSPQAAAAAGTPTPSSTKSKKRVALGKK